MQDQRMGAPPSTGENIIASLWRGAVWLRIVTYLFAIGSLATHYQSYTRPTLGFVVLGVMGGWTAVTVYWFSRPSGRRLNLVIADQVVVNLLVLTSMFILSQQQLADMDPAVTTIWATGPVASAGIYGGRAAGTVAGLAISVTSYLNRLTISTSVARDTALLIGVGFVLGLAAAATRQAAEQMARALRAEAATAERERLARSIHDGVLQVLARVRRRGGELGGGALELARIAGEQEVALRALVAAAPPESTATGDIDIVPGLQVLNTSTVHVSLPATRVPLPEPLADELLSLVREALSNVDKHAGDDAHAWVLLEDLGACVIVTVRDDGPGIPDGRLTAAASEGRMGVSMSIRKRAEALGAEAVLHTGSGEGTEWEIRLPRPLTSRKGTR